MSKFADYCPGGARAPRFSASDGLVIRMAHRSDLAEIADLAAEREGEASEKWLAAFERIYALSLAGHSLLLVATVGEHVVGFGKALRFTPPRDSPPNMAPAGWYLTGVVVHSAYRRRGLGSALTAARLAWIGERSGKAYYFANERNRVSIDLHRAAGFVELTLDFCFPRAAFEGGVGILFVSHLNDNPSA